jgi:hypothetical protein
MYSSWLSDRCEIADLSIKLHTRQGAEHIMQYVVCSEDAKARAKN